MTRLIPLFSVAALLPLIASCSILGAHPDSLASIERANASHHITLATAELEADELTDAIERLSALREIVGLTPEERATTESLLRGAVLRYFDLTESGVADAPDSDDLDDLFALDLPLDLRARAGILAARLLLLEDHPVLAYRQIRQVDRELLGHPARALAAEVLAELGLQMIRNDSNYYWIFSYRNRGMTALEYLVLQYPLSAACPEAYTELALHYEDAGDLDYAIERLEDLIVYHPLSEFTTAAEARLPYLRMQRLARDDYDRGELVVAADEIDRWVARHRGHELEPWVRDLERACESRLARSDLYLAHYYDDIDAPFGARLYAERALAEALSADDSAVAVEARGILRGLPERMPRVDEIGPVVPISPPDADGAVGSGS